MENLTLRSGVKRITLSFLFLAVLGLYNKLAVGLGAHGGSS